MTNTDDDFEPWIWDDSGYEMNFVAQMRDLREAKGWSQTELAKRLSEHRLKFHQPTVQRIERGERPLKLTEAIVIAEVLGVRFETMLRAANVTMTYDELSDRVGAGSFDFLLREAEAVQWRLNRGIEGTHELIHAYQQSVAQTPGAEEESELVAVAKEYIRLNEKLLEDAETLVLMAQDAAREFNQLPRNYPATYDEAKTKHHGDVSE